MLDESANPLNSLPEEFIRDALNWLRRHYTMLMIAQRLSTVRPGALDHSTERRPGQRSKLPGGTPGGRLPFSQAPRR
jgi:hypothetical protein